MTDHTRLDEIRARVEAATPGPWTTKTLHTTLADADFIAHSRADVPFLLNLVASLTAERDALSLVESPDPRSLAAIEVARRYAVGAATRGELAAARAAARAAAWAAELAAARARYSNWLVVRIESGY